MQRRWGGAPPPTPEAARERLIDAAEACFDRQGVARTTIDDVATEAGVSRATVYRHVRDRDDLVLAALAREADRFLARMADGGDRPLGAGIVDGIVFAVREVPTTPRLAALMRPGAASIVPGAWEVLYERALLGMGALLERARAEGALRDDVSDGEVVEWVLRTVLSFLTVTVPRDEAELRAYLERFLVPALAVPVRS